MRQTKRKLLAKPSNLKLLTNYYPWKLVFSLMCVFLHSYRPWAASGGPWAPFLHMCPSFPPQKQVDLSPLMLSSQKMDQKAAFWAPILKSQSHWVMSFENIWTLKLDYLPAGDVFLLINPLGAAARRWKDLVLGHCCRCVPPSNGERASEVSFKRQRRTEKLALMHPWKELQRWAVTDSMSRQAHWTPGGAEVQREKQYLGNYQGPENAIFSPLCNPTHARLSWPDLRLCAQAPWFFRSAPSPEAEPSSPMTLTQAALSSIWTPWVGKAVLTS